MADISYAPGSPGLPSSPHSTDRSTDGHTALSTAARIGRAWVALPNTRRRLAGIGALAALSLALGATRVIDIAPAIALALVGLLAGAAAVVDQHENRLPNTLLTLALVPVAAAAVIGGAWTVVDVAISMTMAAFPLWAVRYGKGLALGDVKFAAVLGAAVGLVHPFAGLAIVWCAALASGLFALATRRNRLALGPWLWAGYVAAGAAAVVFVRVLEIGGHTWPARP